MRLVWMALIGLLSGVGGIALGSWLTESPRVLGGPWWDVMTAIGTLLSAGLALWFWFYQRKKDASHQEAMAKVMAARLVIAMRGPAKQISDLLSSANTLRDQYDGLLHEWIRERDRFEGLLKDLEPFCSDSDCEAFYPVNPGLAGWMAVALGSYEQLKDKSLLSRLSSGEKYSVDNLRIIGVALQTIQTNMRRSRAEFYKLRKEFSMDSNGTKAWIEWMN